MRALVAALLTGLLFAAACSGDDSGQGPGSTARTIDPEESTQVSSTAGSGATEPSPPEATLGTERDPPGVMLRLEGDPKTTFSGICAVGGNESVLSGRVPKRYAFDPEGQRLSCRIQKQDPGKGSLKVILTAGDTTRSVQQTDARGGVISISYKGG
ncbi:MAG: hypothetical protein M3N00_01790 [Actinomycetota bacterium]|nr:hypothetical protein [Actinomycetota bacterium]